MKTFRSEFHAGFSGIGINPEDISARNSGLLVDCMNVRLTKNGLEGYTPDIKSILDADCVFASTVELMSNKVDRDFSGASAWTNVDINAYDETGDLTITASAAGQYCTCPVASMPTSISSKYRLKFDVANIVGTWTLKSYDGTQTIGTVTGNGLQQVFEWTATTTGGLRIVSVATNSSGDFDNFTLSIQIAITRRWPFPQVFLTDVGLFIGALEGLFWLADDDPLTLYSFGTGAVTWPWSCAPIGAYPAFTCGDVLVYMDDVSNAYKKVTYA